MEFDYKNYHDGVPAQNAPYVIRPHTTALHNTNKSRFWTRASRERMVDDTPGPRAADMCSIGGMDSLSQDNHSDDHCDPVLPEEQNSPSAAAAAPEAAIAGKEGDFASARTQTPRDNVEETEAVRRLDEELEELERLMVLQRRKVDALERLRRQWLSGER